VSTAAAERAVQQPRQGSVSSCLILPVYREGGVAWRMDPYSSIFRFRVLCGQLAASLLGLSLALTRMHTSVVSHGMPHSSIVRSCVPFAAAS